MSYRFRQFLLVEGKANRANPEEGDSFVILFRAAESPGNRGVVATVLIVRIHSEGRRVASALGPSFSRF